MNCPLCQNPMRPNLLTGVEIDVCPRCQGVWLDRGELEEILARTAAGRDPGDRSEPYRRADRDHHDDHGHNQGRPWGGERDHDDDREHGHGSRKRRGLLGDLFDFG
ncbi:MAG TPA: zf-TFIIB domain-containing protein [Armatimonadota bacterium]